MAEKKKVRISLTQAEGRKVNQFCTIIRNHAEECVAFIDQLTKRYKTPVIRGKYSGRVQRYVDCYVDDCESEYIKLFSLFLRSNTVNICKNFLEECRAKNWCSAEHLTIEAPPVESIKKNKSIVVENSLDNKTIDKPVIVEPVPVIETVLESNEPVVDESVEEPKQQMIAVNGDDLYIVLKYVGKIKDANLPKEQLYNLMNAYFQGVQ